MRKPQTPAEREQEDKAVAVIKFCLFVAVTFFVVGMLTSIYVAAVGLIIALLIDGWYFLILPKKKQQR